MRISNYLLIILITFFSACASSEETTKQIQQKEPEVYIFDDVEKVDTSAVELPMPKKVELSVNKPTAEEEQRSVKKFIVQVGAFTSKERAQSFIKENQNKIDFVMSIFFSDQVQLYVVQLPPFAAREEAEKARNTLWQIPNFKDAFIITAE